MSALTKDFRVNDVPNLQVLYDHGVSVEFDDMSGRHVRLSFQQTVAYRLTVEDCFDFSTLTNQENEYRTLMELHNSEWKSQLYRESVQNFQPINSNSLRHFVLILGDVVLEIVAENYRVSFEAR